MIFIMKLGNVSLRESARTIEAVSEKLSIGSPYCTY